MRKQKNTYIFILICIFVMGFLLFSLIQMQGYANIINDAGRSAYRQARQNHRYNRSEWVPDSCYHSFSLIIFLPAALFKAVVLVKIRGFKAQPFVFGIIFLFSGYRLLGCRLRLRGKQCGKNHLWGQRKRSCPGAVRHFGWKEICIKGER